MKINYKSEIKDSYIKKKLLRLENIPIVEDILDNESQKLKRLQNLKENNKLDFGNKVSPKDLKKLFPEICTDVNDFLGIQKHDIPKFRYYNSYKGKGLIPSLYSLSAFPIVSSLLTNTSLDMTLISWGAGISLLMATSGIHLRLKITDLMYNNSGYNLFSKAITLEKVARTDLIPTMGHEYAHYVQHNKGIEEEIFGEGHARGVQKQIAKEYHEKEDNEAFLYNASDQTVGEFKSAYIWMCEELKKTPKKKLLKIKTSQDKEETLNRVLDKEPTPHAIGNTIFSIYESLMGKDIYKKAIHGKLKFT